MRASYKERWKTVRTGKGFTEIHLSPGQFIFGRASAAKALQMEQSTIRNRMQKLCKAGNIELKPDTHYTIVTICNWEIYQGEEKAEGQAIGQPKDNQRTTKGHIQSLKALKPLEEESKEVAGKDRQPCPHLKIISLYNEKLKMLTPVNASLWNGTRATNLRARWKEDKDRQSEEWWSVLFDLVADMPFLLGDNDRSWKADLGWIVKRENMVKILEGKYRRMSNASTKPNNGFKTFSQMKDERTIQAINDFVNGD